MYIYRHKIESGQMMNSINDSQDKYIHSCLRPFNIRFFRPSARFSGEKFMILLHAAIKNDFGPESPWQRMAQAGRIAADQLTDRAKKIYMQK